MKNIIIFILIAGLGLFAILRLQSQKAQPNNIDPASQNVLESQTNSEGPVAVEVTPNLFGQAWTFKITLTTHSGSLDEDMTKVATLTDEKGNSYTPSSWQGSPPGGHHREGDLIFPPITPKPKSITLKVATIGGIAERNFLWNLGGE